jgi:membrane fusion protein (multidrug efflux system)
VQVTKAQMDLAQSRLDRTDIVAPIAGVLNRLPVEVGEYCQPGQHVAEIVDIATAKVVVDVPEKDIYYLQVGDKVEVLANAREPVEVTGTIRYISELADPVSKTTSVEVAVPNPRRATGRQPVGALQPSWQSDRLFRSGQIVKVRITRRLLRDAIMVPMRAVIPTPEKDTYYVYVEENGLAQRRDVAIGLIRGVDVQVTEGLNAGDRLIVEGQRFVAPDQPVQITGGLADPDARPPTPERPEPNAPTPAQTAPDANPAEPTPPEPDRPDRRDAGDRRDTGADRPAGRR